LFRVESQWGCKEIVGWMWCVCRREVCWPWQHQMGISIMHRRLTANDSCGILLQMVKLPLLMGILGKKIHWQIV